MLKNLQKPNIISDLIFYSPKNSDIYRMIDIKKRTYVGEMSITPRKDLFIKSLFIRPEYQRQGYGTKFLDFACIISKKLGLNGNLRVIAGTLDDIKTPSHIFFRKYGFTSDNKKILAKIDNFIRAGKELNYKELPLIYMYLKG